MTQILETQPERTDLPLTVMPCVVADMIEPFKANFEVLRDVTRLRMYTDTTLDPDEIVRRCEGADAVIVIGVHIDDNLYTRLTHTQAPGWPATSTSPVRGRMACAYAMCVDMGTPRSPSSPSRS